VIRSFCWTSICFFPEKRNSDPRGCSPFISKHDELWHLLLLSKLKGHEGTKQKPGCWVHEMTTCGALLWTRHQGHRTHSACPSSNVPQARRGIKGQGSCFIFQDKINTTESEENASWRRSSLRWRRHYCQHIYYFLVETSPI
jgi:hypothetical protein